MYFSEIKSYLTLSYTHNWKRCISVLHGELYSQRLCIIQSKLLNKNSEGTEQKWCLWAGDLIRQVKISAVLSNGALKSGLNMEGGPIKQGSLILSRFDCM